MYQEAMQFLTKYTNSFSFPAGQWYVGITNDANNRLFTQHKVDQQGVWAMYSCISHEVARQIERVLLSNGMRGGSGGGDESSLTVYVYLITDHTDEQN